MVVSDKWLQAAMRRAGHNPTDIEVLDIINKIDNDSGGLDFQVPYMIKSYIQIDSKGKDQIQGVHYKLIQILRKA